MRGRVNVWTVLALGASAIWLLACGGMGGGGEEIEIEMPELATPEPVAEDGSEEGTEEKAEDGTEEKAEADTEDKSEGSSSSGSASSGKSHGRGSSGGDVSHVPSGRKGGSQSGGSSHSTNRGRGSGGSKR